MLLKHSTTPAKSRLNKNVFAGRRAYLLTASLFGCSLLAYPLSIAQFVRVSLRLPTLLHTRYLFMRVLSLDAKTCGVPAGIDVGDRAD